MRKQGGNEIARQPVALLAMHPDAGGGKRLEFPERRPHGALVGGKDALIRTEKCRQRNRLWRRDREVVENAPVGHGALALHPSVVGPLCQGLPGPRMLIPAEPEEIVGPDFAGQSEPFRARPPPLARYALPFVRVVADGKVLLKVFLRIPETVLRL